MHFFSDLDRTLINPISLCQDSLDTLECIEYLDSKPLTYATKACMNDWNEILSLCTFIPVTARTKAQFERISFLRDSRIRHVILNNGGTILIDGVEDKEWSETVTATIAANCETMVIMQHTIESMCGTQWMRRRRLGDCHFFYFDVDTAVFPKPEFAIFSNWANEKGWDSFLQDRKLYMMPKALNKVHAVSYLQNKLGVSRTFAAGDAIMDLKMLQLANTGFTPLHGEIVESELQQGLKVVRTGALGSQDICECILHELKISKAIS